MLARSRHNGGTRPGKCAFEDFPTVYRLRHAPPYTELRRDIEKAIAVLPNVTLFQANVSNGTAVSRCRPGVGEARDLDGERRRYIDSRRM